MSLFLYGLAAALCLVFNPSPALALASGLLLALTLANPRLSWCKKLSRQLLQISVVLLGFTMNLYAVLQAGLHGMGFAIGTIAGSFAVGALLARWLRIEAQVSTLISAGTAICGGSAIAAVGGAIGAAEGDMAVALGTVFILNAAALYLFPPLGHWLGLTGEQFGTWAGVAIHDISSVYGAAQAYGADALATATAVKLARALWIFPVALVAGHRAHRKQQGGVAVPWFIFLFFAASIVSTTIPAMGAQSLVMKAVAQRGLALTLFLIGSTLSVQALREVGWRPLMQGFILWLTLAAASLGIILWM